MRGCEVRALTCHKTAVRGEESLQDFSVLVVDVLNIVVGEKISLHGG